MQLTTELSDELNAVAKEEGCSLLDARFAGHILRLVVEHPGGTTLEHCESISRQASALLDAYEYGSDRYVLEVSSPGLDRELYGPDDYARFTGKRVKIKFSQDDGRKQTLRGTLSAFDPAQAVIELTEQDRHENIVIPLRNIELAKLEIDL